MGPVGATLGRGTGTAVLVGGSQRVKHPSQAAQPFGGWARAVAPPRSTQARSSASGPSTSGPTRSQAAPTA